MEYVTANATSILIGNAIKILVIKQTLVMDPVAIGRTQELYVSSTKGFMGYFLGVLGALEAAFVIQSMVKNIILPTANLEEWTMQPFVTCKRIQTYGYKYGGVSMIRTGHESGHIHGHTSECQS